MYLSSCFISDTIVCTQKLYQTRISRPKHVSSSLWCCWLRVVSPRSCLDNTFSSRQAPTHVASPPSPRCETTKKRKRAGLFSLACSQSGSVRGCCQPCLCGVCVSLLEGRREAKKKEGWHGCLGCEEAGGSEGCLFFYIFVRMELRVVFRTTSLEY